MAGLNDWTDFMHDDDKYYTKMENDYKNVDWRMMWG